jgi:Arc/MetJ-type ribon-helix-helix transcriptional regulator
MAYSIPGDVEQQIDELLASGSFSSADEVLRSAFAALAKRRADLEAIREGIADIEAGRYVTRDEFDAEMHDRFGFLSES